MKRVFCLDDETEYYFDAISGYSAIGQMLYTLNLEHKDSNAKIKFNGKTWSLEHNGKTYGCEL